MEILTLEEESYREKHDKLAKETLELANRRYFERECKANGINPVNGVSPALLSTIKNSRRI